MPEARNIGRRGLLVGASVAALPARAADFPEKPIALVVPFAAGGAIDVMARLIGEQASRALGQPVLVDNRGGAAGLIGAAAVARSEREGKTVLVHCYAGSQRTGGVVALYRLLVLHWTPADVLREMQQYKYDPVESPILLQYLNAHMREIATDLVADGTIPALPDPLPRFDLK